MGGARALEGDVGHPDVAADEGLVEKPDVLPRANLDCRAWR